MHGPDWLETLIPHAARLTDIHLADLIGADASRAGDYGLQVGPLYMNFARQKLDRPAAVALQAVAQLRDVRSGLRRLFDGERVNVSEGRAALHSALRGPVGSGPAAEAARREAEQARLDMAQWVTALDASAVTDVIHVGIGGSDLGPRLAIEALRDFDRRRFRLHFLSNVDGSAAQHVLRGLDPTRSAVILVSKSFTTQETLLNGALLRAWLGDSKRLYAVSANRARAHAFGIPAERVLPMWEWLGGRYSLWSAAGITIALALGMDGFEAMLRGAAMLDEHVCNSSLERNLSVWHALCAVWNRNALGFSAHAIVPYDDRLVRLPAYLQQLMMESLGKSVSAEGQPIPCATVPVIWGGVGTDSQHSFFQALHQGTDTVPVDFIGVLRPAHPYPEHHRALLANLLAQSEALANGAVAEDLRKQYPGDRPSTLILLDELTPAAFGALIALYEHSVYVQSVLWGINAFDQWGVELGKHLAARLLPALGDPAGVGLEVRDPITRAMLERIAAG